MLSNSKLSELIVEAIHNLQSEVTYIIKNRVNQILKKQNSTESVTTPQVRNQLLKMEKEGKVKRLRQSQVSTFKNQLHWEIAND